jgi:sortase A
MATSGDATRAEVAAPRRSTRRRRTVRRLGTALVGVGIIGLAWAAAITFWQDPFTALYAKRAQARLATDYEERVREIRPILRSPAAKEIPLATLAHRFGATTHTGEAVARLRIPRMGLNTIVVDGTDHNSLKKGPGIDERTHLPGEGQLVYIAGHRTTYLAPFSHIDRLRAGDPVTLSTPYATFDYRVSGHVIVPANDIGRLKSRGREELALQACHPRFFATQRYIVYSKLVRVRRARG